LLLSPSPFQDKGTYIGFEESSEQYDNINVEECSQDIPETIALPHRVKENQQAQNVLPSP
jgi:hypothetical protein